MRKIVVGAFVSMDGVMQAPGGPDEDKASGFRYGGWLVPFFDQKAGEFMGELFNQPYDLLLGRKTYDIFADHWGRIAADHKLAGDEGDVQIADSFTKVTKYVATHNPGSLKWANSKSLGDDVLKSLRELKKTSGPMLLTQGSTELLHLLFKNDLVDQVNVLTFPVVLGEGKRLFDTNSVAKSFKLVRSEVTSTGVILASYEKAGEIKSGNFQLKS